MKKQIIGLIVSIVLALIVICVGVFGAGRIKSSEKNNKSEKNTSKVVESDSNKEDTSKKDEVNSEETTSDEVTTQPESTTPEETTSEGESVDKIDYSNPDIDPTKPMVALTFDDGPGGESTIRILDALKKYNAHATFFVVGSNIDKYADIIKREAAEGSEVGNHTNSHAQLTKLDTDGILSEVNGVKEKVMQLTGQSVVPIRPPYGAVDDNVMAAISDPVILWSIDTLDWKTRDAQSTIQNIQSSVYDGAIILMHDIYSTTADAAVNVIDWLHSQGYQMVTVSELGYYRRGGLKTGVRYGALQPE
ncbi:MAG: polysaccharide deacetylase family protein [Clostridiales bacterium]|nr:polysaccharide deacetylase family protein [Clostridiales bacterium]